MLGAILIFFKSKNTDRVVCSSLAFASGVMIMVSITDLIPSAISGFLNIYYLIPAILFTLIFLILGIVISTLINKYIPDIGSNDISNKGLFKVGIISMIAIILHNIPEGISISVPIYYSTKSKFKSLLYTFISGISELVGAVIAYLFLAPYMNEFVMSILMALIAGIMISISIYELIPASLKYKRVGDTIKFFLIGVIFMGLCHIFM